MIHDYRWLPNGKTFACACGLGTVRGYDVIPRRSRTYLNHVFVCDSELCDEAVVHRGTGRERRGRFILA